jgi:hypothetical protein
VVIGCQERVGRGQNLQFEERRVGTHGSSELENSIVGEIVEGRPGDLSVLTVPVAAFGRFNDAEQNASILAVKSALSFS